MYHTVEYIPYRTMQYKIQYKTDKNTYKTYNTYHTIRSIPYTQDTQYTRKYNRKYNTICTTIHTTTENTLYFTVPAISTIPYNTKNTINTKL